MVLSCDTHEGAPDDEAYFCASSCSTEPKKVQCGEIG